MNTEAARLSAGEGVNTAPGLTLTGLYNVLAALREGRPLTPKEKTIHAQGLVGVLRDLHDQLDAAVLAAYGLPEGSSGDALLEPLVRLGKVDTQAEPALGQRFDVRSIPMLALFKDGRELDRRTGVATTAEIVRWTRQQLRA